MAMQPFYPTVYEQINYYRREREFLGILTRNRCEKNELLHDTGQRPKTL